MVLQRYAKAISVGRFGVLFGVTYECQGNRTHDPTTPHFKATDLQSAEGDDTQKPPLLVV